jgi:hypothetical protein
MQECMQHPLHLILSVGAEVPAAVGRQEAAAVQLAG